MSILTFERTVNNISTNPNVLRSHLKKQLDRLLSGETSIEECLDKIIKYNQNHIRKTPKALSESEAKYRLITDNEEDVIWTMDLNAKFTYVSPSIVNLRGVTVEEAMKESIIDTLCPEFIPEIGQLVDQAFSYLAQHGEFPSADVQLKQKRKDGTGIWVEMFIKGLYNDAGQCTGILGLTRNIDRRKNAEEKLKESEESFRGLFNTIKDAIFILNLNGEIIEINNGAVNLFGHKKADFLGNHFDFIDADTANNSLRFSMSFSKTVLGEKQEFEHKCLHRNGTCIPSLISLYPGSYMGEDVVICSIHDISEIKRSKEQLETDRNLLQTIINSAPFEIYVKDKNRVKTISNNRGIPQLGLSAEGLINKTDEEVFPPHLADCFKEEDNRVIEHGESVINHEVLINLSPKNKAWYLTSKVPWLDADNNIQGLVGFGLDISDQKQAMQRQRLLYNISISAIKADSLPQLIEVIHKEMKEFIDISNFLCALYNKEKDTLYAPYYTDEMDNIEEWPAEKSITGYTIGIKKPLLLKEADLKELVNKGTVKIVGSWPKCWISVPLMVEGAAIGALAVQSYTSKDDLNEMHLELLELVAHEMSVFIYKKRTETELIKAKERAIESDKLKSTFLANMSHEIRTPMNAIVGFSELINEEELAPEERTHYTEIIQQRSYDLLTLIDDILDVSKIEVGQIKIIKSDENIVHILSNIYESYDLLWIQSEKSSVRFIFNTEIDPTTTVNTDPARLRQIITNLLNNAFKFTFEGEITLGCKKLDTNFIEIYVSDTGIGIERDKQKKVFERFIQTGEHAGRLGGAGIGLSISKGLVEILGGEISLKSRFGKGSTFSFTLPL